MFGVVPLVIACQFARSWQSLAVERIWNAKQMLAFGMSLVIAMSGLTTSLTTLCPGIPAPVPEGQIAEVRLNGSGRIELSALRSRRPRHAGEAEFGKRQDSVRCFGQSQRARF